MSSTKKVKELVEKLRKASDAYYNGLGDSAAGGRGPIAMTDDAYDALLEELKALDPTNPYLSEVGSPPPPEDAVKLPYPMPSLDKIKPGQDQLKRFLANPGGFVLSEKLDGLSALWIPGSSKLFLRGDGLLGQDISHLVPLGIQGLKREFIGAATTAIRGELILPRAAGEKLARSWVNGLVHRKAPARSDVARIHFVAYELLSPTGISRGDQIKWLQMRGFEVAWTMRVAAGVTEAMLEATLKERRAVSPYDTDGIVVGLDAPPKSESTAERARNPKDCVAFKMPLAEQGAETTVREVLWGTSAQGYLIPKLRFDPVVIGSASIQFCTAHNAKVVHTERLGPGARIVVQRSGDVIPKLERVIAPATSGGVEGEVEGRVEGGAPSFPPEGTYEWDATGTHIKMIGGGEANTELLSARLGHFLKTLEIPGCGAATVEVLVSAGITGPALLWGTTADKLSDLLGPKTGASLWTNLRSAVEKADEKRLMLASSQMPRGVGDTKLSSLFKELGADPAKWAAAAGGAAAAATTPSGWTAGALADFWPALEKYRVWRAKELAFLGAKSVKPVAEKGGERGKERGAERGILCMTGFRDKALEERAASAGYGMSSGVTGKVTHLIVPDEEEIKESEKVKTARAKGIPILRRTQFMQQYLGS